MKITWFSLFRSACIFSVLILLSSNGIGPDTIAYWLILIIMLAFGLSEHIEQYIKKE